MWLLDTQSLELENFVDELEALSYAILSHTWGSEEVTFQQMKGRAKEIENKLGYIKIWNCYKEAAADGFDYAWIDTCCIDKTSSAELSEAINSMYRWYQAAGLCYVYLDDVLDKYDLDKSRWFTRGWTLQELLASSRLTFFNRQWYIIGTKNSLLNRISSSANIPASVLMHGYGDASIAQKMSWAAFR